MSRLEAFNERVDRIACDIIDLGLEGTCWCYCLVRRIALFAGPFGGLAILAFIALPIVLFMLPFALLASFVNWRRG